MGFPHLASGSHLPREETPKLVGRLYDGPIPRDIGLGRQGVVRLPAGEGPRDLIHGEDRGILGAELVNEVAVLGGV